MSNVLLFCFQIVFEGVVGSSGTGYIAIDDVLVRQHPDITENNCLFTSSYARPSLSTPSPPSQFTGGNCVIY
mgnify:CR=1 FL=1